MSSIRLSVAVFALSAAAFGSGCDSESPETTPPDETGSTYYGEIKQLVDDRCVSCHQEGGIAPFALTSFEQVRDNAAGIKAAVSSGTMPPWPAEAGCNEYANDRSLADDEKDTLIDWVDRGAPEGAVSALEDDGKTKNGLSRVDLSLEMATEYTPVLNPDDYRCFLLDWPEDATKFVTGFRANPGNAAIVHHVIAYLVPPSQVAKYDALDAEDSAPGYTCFGGPGGGIDQDTRFVGSWAPGADGGDFPKGTGIKVEPGSKIALQVHYNTLNAGHVPDRTSIDMRIDDHVDHEAQWQFFTNLSWVLGSGMDIPPMSQGVTHSYELDPTPFVSGGKAFDIHSVGVHMHTFGRAGKLKLERAAASQSEECLVSVPDWNFHWQLTYQLDEAVHVEPGDKLSIECEWDNSTPDTIRWGEGTGDEMCLGLIYYTL